MRYPGDVCESCAYFDSSGHSGAAEDGGFCRAHSPVADDRNGLARWPTVDWSDWCAEYVKAVEPEIPKSPPAPVIDDDDIPF